MSTADRPTAEMVTVSPALAREWLGRNQGNRHVRTANVSRLARDITAGNWQVTGESIKFTPDGTLIDGQHRLLAVIEADTAIDIFVVRGVDPSARGAIDTQAGRTASDWLAMQGYSNAATLAGAARWAILFDTGRLHVDNKARGVTHFEIQDYVEGNETIAAAVSVVIACKRKILCVPSVLAAGAYVCMRVDRESAAMFFSQLADLTNLPPGSPILALYARQRQLRLDRVHLDGSAHLALIVRTWNAWREGRPMASISPFHKGSVIPCPDPK